VLLLKVLLKQAKLNEVFTGGLSSWSLVNMVVAHLQAEGMAADLHWLPHNVRDPRVLVGVQQAMQFLEDMTHQQEQLEEEEEEEEEEQVDGQVGVGDGGRLKSILAQGSAVAAAGRGKRRAPGGGDEKQGDDGKQCWDYGCLLVGFFKRYGQLFDLETEGVDVMHGGIMQKGQVDGGLLWLRDPVEGGERNVANGSHRISEVREKYNLAVRQLEDAGAVAVGTAGWPPMAAAAGGGGEGGERTECHCVPETGDFAEIVQGGGGDGREEEEVEVMSWSCGPLYRQLE
jgi:DNA polymerase sigma